MTNFHDAWFLLQNSAYPWGGGMVFFFLGLWFAYVLWYRWVRRLHEMRREQWELEVRLQGLTKRAAAGGGPAPGKGDAGQAKALEGQS